MSAYRPEMPLELADLVLTSEGDRLNAVLKAAYCSGWTLQELADITGVTRERIRQRTNKKVPLVVIAEVEDLIPTKPAKARKAPAQRRPNPIDAVPADVLAAIKDLQERSAATNGGTNVGDPRRAAGDELCLTVRAAMDQYSVSVYALSRAIGLNPQTLAARLRARGVIHRPPSAHVYKNKKLGGSSSHCKRGHERSSNSNAWGQCKPCMNQRAKDRYQQAKAA